MIYSIGIDSVDIARFSDFSALGHRQLERIFSPEEIHYCRSAALVQQQAERFAARFAAREAFWKSLCAYEPHHTIPFFTFCKSITITHLINGAPTLQINWQPLHKYLPAHFCHTFTIHLSLTHTKTIANAFVILSD